MFKRKKKEADGGPVEEAVRESTPASGDRALDTLVEVLRSLGEFAFDTSETDRETTQERFEGWARHLLLGVAPPGVASIAEGVRDWPGLSRFTHEHREHESEYVTVSIAGLREALWLFVQGVSRAIPDDEARDVAVQHELGRVRSSLDSNDVDQIRSAVLESTAAIEKVIADRSERSRKQIEVLSAEIDRFTAELNEAREQLERDALTKLYNRGAFDEVLERTVDLARLSARRSTLFLLDIDDFKWVNDKFGHPGGDEVLKEVSNCLQAAFSRKTDFVARYGGDELAVVVPSEGAEEDVVLGEGAVLGIRDLVIPYGEEQIRVTVSMGAAQCHPGEDAASWLARADQALYEAKQLGRDRLVSYADHPEISG